MNDRIEVIRGLAQAALEEQMQKLGGGAASQLQAHARVLEIMVKAWNQPDKVGAQIDTLYSNRKRRRKMLAGDCAILPESFPVDTSSPEFREWFQGSVLTGPDGEPQPFYHGTCFDFTEFASDAACKVHGADRHGLYFTPHRATAESYGDKVLTVYLRMLAPLRLLPSEASQISFIPAERISEWRAQGYDGVIKDLPWVQVEYAVFEPSQVRVIAREPVED